MSDRDLADRVEAMSETAERPGDRELWQPTDSNVKASVVENIRVRELLLKALQVAVDADESDTPTRLKWAAARGEFARDWVALAERENLIVPGQEQRTPLRKGQTANRRRVDAARTRVRQFLEGHLELEWVLIGIESVCNDRLGRALPGKAYQTQERLL